MIRCMNKRALQIMMLGIFVTSCTERKENLPRMQKPSAPASTMDESTNHNITGTHKSRALTEIKLTGDLTREQVAALWGPPDDFRGSGVDYLEYHLSDGNELWLEFFPEPPYRLRHALLFSAKTRQHTTLFWRQ